MNKKIRLFICFLLSVFVHTSVFSIGVKIKLDGQTKEKIEEINATIGRLESIIDDLPYDAQIVLESVIRETKTTLEHFVSNLEHTGLRFINEAGEEINGALRTAGEELQLGIETAGKESRKIIDDASSELIKASNKILGQTEEILTKVNRDMDEITKGNINELTYSLDELAKSTTEGVEKSMIRVITHAEERTQNLIMNTIREAGINVEKRMELGEAILSRQGDKFVSLLKNYTDDSAQVFDKILENRTKQATDSALQLLNETNKILVTQLSGFDNLLAGRMKQMERIGLTFVDAFGNEMKEVVTIFDSKMQERIDDLDSRLNKLIDRGDNLMVKFFQQLNVSSTLFINVITKGVAAILILMMIFGITLRAVKYEKSIKPMQIPFLLVFFVSMGLFIYASYPIQGKYAENTSREVATLENHYQQVLKELQSGQIDSELKNEVLATIDLFHAYERSIVPTTHKALQKRYEIRKKADLLATILY